MDFWCFREEFCLTVDSLSTTYCVRSGNVSVAVFIQDLNFLLWSLLPAAMTLVSCGRSQAILLWLLGPAQMSEPGPWLEPDCSYQDTLQKALPEFLPVGSLGGLQSELLPFSCGFFALNP